MKKSSQRKLESGRVAEQLSPGIYRDAPFELKIVMAVFGKKAVHPDFLDMLGTLVSKLNWIADKKRKTLKKRQRDKDIRSAMAWVRESNLERSDARGAPEANAEIPEDIRETINEYHSLLDEQEFEEEVRLADREDPDFQRILLSGDRVFSFDSFEGLAEFDKDLLKKLDPEVFSEDHGYHRLATEVRNLLRVEPDDPDENSLMLAQRMVIREEVQWADPIRFWVLIAYRRFFEKNHRTPTGIELTAEYRRAMNDFPDRRYPANEDADFVHGEENLRATFGQLGLWLINEKFAKAIEASARNSRASSSSGEALLSGITLKTRIGESFNEWTIHEFFSRIQWISWTYQGEGIKTHPLFEVFSRIDYPFKDPKSSLIDLILSLILELRPPDTGGGQPESTANGSGCLLSDSTRFQILESLAVAREYLVEQTPSGTETSYLDSKISVLFRKNRMFREMVDHCFHRFVEQIASTRPAR